MDIDLLQEFIVLAQSETFLKAADILYISQPTLSRHIKNLEEDLGVALFERTTRSSKLSKYGNMLLPYAKQIVELQNQFTSELVSEKQEQHTSLRIGTMSAMASYGITSVLTNFREKYPEIKMDIIPGYNVQPKDMLLRRDCELAFVRELESESTEDADEFVWLPYTTDRLVAVVPEKHPLAAHDQIQLTELKHQDLITLPRERTVSKLAYAACAKAGFEPKLTMTDHNVDHIIDCVRLGMGIALLTDKHADSSRPQMKGLKSLIVLPEIGTRISLCYLKNARLSSGAQKFVQAYQERMGLQEA